MEPNAWGLFAFIIFVLVCLSWCRNKIGKLEYKVNAMEKEFERVKYIDDEE